MEHSWNIHKTIVVYQDEQYTLGQENELPYLIANGMKYTLTCHPFEPCLYITDEDNFTTAVHNAFDPFYVLEAFSKGENITSITGRKYKAKDFCKMVDNAAYMGDVQIDIAEKVLSRQDKKKISEKSEQKEKTYNRDAVPFTPDTDYIIYEDPFYDVIDEYTFNLVDFYLVQNAHTSTGKGAHWYALLCACRDLFFDDDEQIWGYDCGDADGKQITVDEFFSAPKEKCGENYRGAFLYPPHGGWLTNKDFDYINEVLFPNGTEELEVYKWSTDWSEYFDDGHEWWGSICYTVYDKTLDRFVVIMASATD
ncbi:MAG: hypothetical protein K6F14_08255 [Clostridiales bacterium]|nr:hypothetical protein [Clostridiales bacterium]